MKYRISCLEDLPPGTLSQHIHSLSLSFQSLLSLLINMQLLVVAAALMGAAKAQDMTSVVNTQCFTRYALQSTANIETIDLATTTSRTAVVSVTETPQETVTPLAVTSSVTTTRTIFNTITLPIRTNTYTTSVTLSTTLTNTEIESYTQTMTESSTTTLQSTTTVRNPRHAQ